MARRRNKLKASNRRIFREGGLSILKKSKKRKKKVAARALSLRFHLRVLLILFFISGFSSLVYEVAWGRILTLVMGGSIYAVSVILATFMGGLALGSFTLGRISDRSKNPLLLYSILEFAIGLYGLAVPTLSAYLDDIYIPLAGGITNRFIVMMIRSLVAFLFLLLPTFLMGGTFPVMIRHLTRSLEKLGNTVGKLYASNTFGGVAGALLSGVFMIKVIGLRSTVTIAAALNIIVCAFALLLSRWQVAEETHEKEESVPEAAPMFDIPRSVLLIAIALSGLSSLAYEVIWTRMLMFVLGNSTWAFAIMLVTFLTGIAVGSMIISRYLDRMQKLILIITLIEISAAIVSLFLIPAYGKLYNIRKWIVDATGTVGGMFVAMFVVSFLAMILPTLLLGMIFPAISKAYTRSIDTVGRGIGALYSLNTIGAIIGSMLPAFLLIPHLGLRGALLAAAVINSVAGVILILPSAAIRTSLKTSLSLIPAVILVTGYILLPTDLEIRGPIVGYERIFKHETTGGIIEVFTTKNEDVRTLVLNGVPEVPTDRISMQTFRLLAFLPVLIHPRPEEVLVVTFGGGIVTGTLGRYDLKSIDCVEIFPGIRKAAPFFRIENHDVLENPLVNLMIEDGRNFLLMTEKKYDIITADATHPTGADSWVLYTTEYYNLCRRHLTSDGLFVQWLPLHHLSFEGYCTILKTIRTVFPNVEIWFTGVNRNFGHTIVLASRKELVVDYKQLSERLMNPIIREDLSAYDLDDPMNIISLRLMDERGIDKMVEKAPINTDDKPIISFPTTIPEQTDNLENLSHLIQFRSPTMLSNIPREENDRVKNMLRALPNRYRGEVLYYSGKPIKALREFHRTLSINPYDTWAYRLLARIERKRAKDKLLTDSVLGKELDAEGLFARGYMSFTKKNYEQARELFLQSIEKNSSFPESYCYLGLTYARLGKRQEAKEYLSRALELWPGMGLARRGLIELEGELSKRDSDIK